MSQYDFMTEDRIDNGSTPRTMVLLVGLPRTGKSTTAQRLWEAAGVVPVCGDDARRTLGIRYTRESDWQVQQMCETTARMLMTRGLHVSIDNTNLTRAQRARWIAIATEYGYEVEAVQIVHTDADSLRIHDERLAASHFPPKVINVLRSRFQSINHADEPLIQAVTQIDLTGQFRDRRAPRVGYVGVTDSLLALHSDT